MADPTPLTEQEIADLLAAASEAHLCGTPLAADMAITVMRMIGEHDRRLGELAIIDWEERAAELEAERNEAAARAEKAEARAERAETERRGVVIRSMVVVARAERAEAEVARLQAQGGAVPSPTGTSSAGAVGTTPTDAPSTQPPPQIADLWQRTGGERLMARVVALDTLVHLLPWFPERSALTYQERITRTRGEMLEELAAGGA